jgi:hypothetical protein
LRLSGSDNKETPSALIPDVGFVQMRSSLKHAGTPEQDNKRSPGRPPGSTNKMTREMREAVLGAAEELGQIPFKDWKKEVDRTAAQGEGIKKFYKVLAVKELRSFSPSTG